LSEIPEVGDKAANVVSETYGGEKIKLSDFTKKGISSMSILASETISPDEGHPGDVIVIITFTMPSWISTP